MTESTKKKTAREQAEEAGAKVPADRAAKAEAKNEIIPVTITLDGIDEPFELAVDTDELDDDEALEEWSKKMPARMFRNIAGDREAEFIERLRDERGKIRTSTKVEFVVKVMEAIQQGKS